LVSQAEALWQFASTLVDKWDWKDAQTSKGYGYYLEQLLQQCGELLPEQAGVQLLSQAVALKHDGCVKILLQELQPAISTLSPAAAEQILQGLGQLYQGDFESLLQLWDSVPAMKLLSPEAMMVLLKQPIEGGCGDTLERLLKGLPATWSFTPAQVLELVSHAAGRRSLCLGVLVQIVPEAAATATAAVVGAFGADPAAGGGVGSNGGNGDTRGAAEVPGRLGCRVLQGLIDQPCGTAQELWNCNAPKAPCHVCQWLQSIGPLLSLDGTRAALLASVIEDSLHFEGLACLPGVDQLEDWEVVSVLCTAISKAPWDGTRGLNNICRRVMRKDSLQPLLELLLGPRALPTSSVHGLMVACVALAHVEGLGRVQEVLQLEPGVLQEPPSGRWDVGVLSQQQLELLVKLAAEHGVDMDCLLVLAQQLGSIRERQAVKAAVRGRMGGI
jgi:hypothetical protein